MLRLSLMLVCISGLAWSAEVEDKTQESEVKLKRKEVPAAVLKTMESAAAAAKLDEFEKEQKDGALVYTATFHDAKGVEQEVTVALDGKLIGVAPEEQEDSDEQKAEHHDDKKK